MPFPVFSPPPIFSPQPNVALTYDPPPRNGAFEISQECEMPSFIVTAILSEPYSPSPSWPQLSQVKQESLNAALSALDKRGMLAYHWNITLGFDGSNCPHAVKRGANTAYPPIMADTACNQFRVTFREVEGGDLRVSVLITGPGGIAVYASSQLKVVGTNPAPGQLANYRPAIPLLFRRIINQESRGRQFLRDRSDMPLFNSSNDGGVGICQVTPPQNDEQVWSWKANLAAGLDIWNGKQQQSDLYYQQVRTNRKSVVNTKLDRFVTFGEMINAYNEARRKNDPAAQSLDITLPPLSVDQSEMDTLRGYNGWAMNLHEFQVRVDENGLLHVNVDPSGKSGVAEWEQISGAARIAYYRKVNLSPNHWGDPHYVENVLRVAPAW
jgi:hypothetical protein